MKLRIMLHDAVSVVLFLGFRLRYGKLPLPWRRLEIDPFLIRFSIEPSRFVRSGRYRYSGQVVKSDWNRVIDMPEKHKVLPMAFAAIFSHGFTSNTEAEANLEIDTEDAELFRQFFNHRINHVYAEMFSDFRETGFRPSKFLFSNIDPFFICIGRQGELLFTTGKHRLALAKAAGLETMPVRVAARHVDWIRYRRGFFERIQAGRASEYDKQNWNHPDLQDLIK